MLHDGGLHTKFGKNLEEWEGIIVKSYRITHFIYGRESSDWVLLVDFTQIFFFPFGKEKIWIFYGKLSFEYKLLN